MLSFAPETGVLSRDGKATGTKRKDGYLVVWFEGRLHLAHRVGWYLHYGTWPQSQIDHINGNRSDNRIANLREAEPGQNALNRSKQSNNRSGLKGVHWHRQSNRWRAQIKRGDTRISLGMFTSKKEASAAYREAAAVHHGEFARI